MILQESTLNMIKKVTKADHLVILELFSDPAGIQTKRLQINTLLLKGVVWKRGRRSFKEEVFARRAMKLWTKKHPVISKFWTPLRFHRHDAGFEYWNPPAVRLLFVDGDITVSTMNSNAAAVKLASDIEKMFFTDVI
jgi:hypothetical protein